eukprot:826625-Pleurochrysis_carterae.AAC.17
MRVVAARSGAISEHRPVGLLVLRVAMDVYARLGAFKMSLNGGAKLIRRRQGVRGYDLNCCSHGLKESGAIRQS